MMIHRKLYGGFSIIDYDVEFYGCIIEDIFRSYSIVIY